MSTSSVPALLRQQVDRRAEAWLAAKFSRLLELRAQDPGPFNYPIAVFSEWRGKAFYLNVRYRARSRRPEDEFVIRHTRMTLTGFGRFDLAYFRHTDKWFTVYRGLTAAEWPAPSRPPRPRGHAMRTGVGGTIRELLLA